MIRDTILGHNKIHTLGQKLLSDMGCVYIWGGNQSGLLVDNNLCYNVSSYSCKCKAALRGCSASGAPVVRACRRRLGPLQ